MENVIALVAANTTTIFAVIGAAVTFATTIVKVTPSTKDDEILGKIVKFLDYFSVVNPKK